MDQPRSKTAEDLAAQRAACDRQMAAGRDRFASASAAVRAAARSAVSGAHQSLSRREDLVEFKKRLRDLEADLGQALSLKLTMESKCKRLRESISASAATSEQLRDLVTGQRSRSERHAAVISDVLEAAEAFEAKNDEDVTLMKGMEKAICWYQKRVGFQAVVEGEGVKFIFDKVDSQSPEKEFSFSLKFDKDRCTSVLRCSPPVEDSEELVKDLNLTNDLVKFVRIIRQRFQAAALNGDLPVSPTVCSDASAIPISSPVTKSVDSTSKNDRDKSNSQSKNRKPALPAKRKASALSAASPGSVRRSPRFVQGGTGESPADAYPDLAKLILNR
ncbi:kinetochore protein SPC25 homolog isoform X1 [Triticum aestivum]|uniref:kinetochore protein SPC25 homolog isoform X1 n=1 Tax=Triticum aestivum TaxID=4565 RepID=UPI001D0040CF|nr:kinetochore protein SPC25 homolog isoform X1 [Triticum aestivum]